MVEARKTEAYAKWLNKLRDPQARTHILVRIERLLAGNVGDAKPVGEGVSEHYGPSYRVYFKQQGSALVVLLVGGNKQTQEQDIKYALRLARNL